VLGLLLACCYCALTFALTLLHAFNDSMQFSQFILPSSVKITSESAWILFVLATTSLSCGPVWARECCRISPPRFLAECCKRQLNQGSFVLVYFRLFTFSDLYWVSLSVFSCTVLFVSISQVIGCEDCLRNDLYCVKWGVKLYSNQPTLSCVSIVHDMHCYDFMDDVSDPIERPRVV